MPDFELSYLADQDIVKIINYTVDQWGVEQAALYAGLLDQHFEAIGNNLMLSRAVFDHRNDLCVSRCQKHMVFYWKRENQPPLILAVLTDSKVRASPKSFSNTSTNTFLLQSIRKVSG